MASYQSGLVNLGDGSVVFLPGQTEFSMPGAIGPEIDVYDIDTVQRYPIGTKLYRGDNIFRYAEYGGTTAAGDLVQSEAPDGAHDDLNPAGSGTGSGVAAGSKIISIATSITLVANEYVGGLLSVETDTGSGYSYQIVANEVAAGAANANVTIRDGLAVAIDSTSDAKLTKNKYKEVIQMPTTLTAAIAGVGIGIGADGSFGWAVTRGPWAVLTDGTVVIGQPVRASDGTAGSVEALDRDGTHENEPEVGVVIDVGPTTEWSIIDIALDA